MKEKLSNIFRLSAENDIKYRGFLSSRFIKIMAWFFMAITIVGMVLTSVSSMKFGKDAQPTGFYLAAPYLTTIGSISTPFFIIACLSTVCNKRDAIVRSLIINASLALAIEILLVDVYFRFGVDIIDHFDKGSWHDAEETARFFFSVLFSNRSAFNVFIDLTIFNLMYFFIFYTPRKLALKENRKWLIVFRCGIILPILYEVASLVLKAFDATSLIAIHPLVRPLLTTKSPMVFSAFVFILLFLFIRKMVFLKKGNDIAHYKAFLDTNRNSLQFSFVISMAFIVVAIIDISVVCMVYAKVFGAPVGSDEPGTVVKILSALGLGNGLMLLPAVPLLFLFSYTRKHKYPIIDTFVPAGGVILVVICVLEVIRLIAVTW